MVIVRHIANDIGRAIAVLAMVFLCFAAAPPTAVADATLAQQAGAAASTFQALCGDHGQPQLACHAPDACCRPDQALLPPSLLSVEPAFGGVVTVAYAAERPLPPGASAVAGFRSRAPPV